jgi:hypothetical protein
MLTNEQLRVLENLAVAYDEWVKVERSVPEGRPWLHWKTVKGYQYLYQKNARAGRTPSLGRRSPETERAYSEYRERMAVRQAAQDRARSITEKIREYARIYRSLRLPMLDPVAGAILRLADVRGLLGDALIVVGTNAIGAYELEAQVRFAGNLDATDDFDLTWTAQEKTALSLTTASKTPILDLLKDADDTFTVNTERTFQARNCNAYEVDILCAPSVMRTYPNAESLRPTELPEQEWLLLGMPITQILCDRNNMAVKVVAPDPRWMALHKLWLADKPARNRNKVRKDRQQGEVLLKAIADHMPHYAIDASFVEQVPTELHQYLPRETRP